jgi:hypothetical protein
MCLYDMMLVVSFLYFQLNTRAHARRTRKMWPLSRQFCNLGSRQDCDPQSCDREKLKAPLNNVLFILSKNCAKL